jgi:hypothetical protein
MTDYTGLGNVSVQPFWLKTPDFYEIPQERVHHEEAIYAYGEYSMFIMFWNAMDYAAGIVQHCPDCYGLFDPISHVYHQSSQAKCPTCYGTTFFLESATSEGGLKARLVRPAMWSSVDEQQTLATQGLMSTSVSQVQSVSDFRMRSGDFVFRADNTRWRLQEHSTDTIISGFQAVDDERAMIGYIYQQCVLEDRSTVAYIIPPIGQDLTNILDLSVIPNYPVDMSAHEVINGPLIGDDFSD